MLERRASPADGPLPGARRRSHLHRVISGPAPARSASWRRAMLRDIQFWIPLGVLVAGLLLLRWVA